MIRFGSAIVVVVVLLAAICCCPAEEKENTGNKTQAIHAPNALHAPRWQ